LSLTLYIIANNVSYDDLDVSFELMSGYRARWVWLYNELGCLGVDFTRHLPTYSTGIHWCIYWCIHWRIHLLILLVI